MNEKALQGIFNEIENDPVRKQRLEAFRPLTEQFFKYMQRSLARPSILSPQEEWDAWERDWKDSNEQATDV